MRLPGVSESYQNYHNWAVSNQLTDVRRGVCWELGGDSESVGTSLR
jgi:hypothetical protein